MLADVGVCEARGDGEVRAKRCRSLHAPNVKCLSDDGGNRRGVRASEKRIIRKYSETEMVDEQRRPKNRSQEGG